MRPKISIIGAGMVGSQAAQMIALKEIGDVVLIDILGDMAKGKAIDLSEQLPPLESDSKIIGGSDYRLTKNSDVVVIVAGIPRKPGMSREQLLETNGRIVTEVTKKVVKYSPKAILIVVTNPLDAMAWVVKKVSGFPKKRVIGMAGVLDSSRYRTFVAEALGVSSKGVEVLVIGSHNASMVPLVRFATVHAIPAIELLGKKKMNEIVERVKHAGAEIVGLLKQGSAFYAPGTVVSEMVEAIIRDKKQVLPCSVYLEGEYGVKGYYAGVPIVLGKNGVEKIIELKLDKSEKKQFADAVKGIKELVEQVRKVM